MKNLIVGSLIALAASQAAGCIITSGDDSEDAFISATWKISHLSPDMDISCPPGFDTAALYNKSLDGAACDPNDPSSGSTCIELFDCADGSGVSAPLVPNVYQSWIVIANTNNTDQYATSLSAIVDVVDNDQSFNAQILENGGYFQFQWDLVGAQSDRSLSCGEVSATGGIEALATDISDGSNSASDKFDCVDGLDAKVVTAGYRAATYTVSITALNDADQSLGEPVNLTNKVIRDRNQVTDLGLVELPIDGL